MLKPQLRKKILNIRKKKYPKYEEINFNNIIKILKKEKINNKIIGGYYPYNYEVDTVKILEKFEKLNYLVTLPKIKNNYQMDFFHWSTNDPLLINKYGIPESTSNKINYPNILLVPLVAFDKHLNRVGYGGGFYDRKIKKQKKKKKNYNYWFSLFFSKS